MASLPPSNSEPRKSAPRILVVEDEPIIRQALGEMLAGEGYQVSTAADGTEGLDQLTRNSFAVLLSDNQMPKMRGLEFLSLAREKQPDATRILITGIVDLDTLLDSINSGELYRFILKPWVREELLITVKNAAQRYELITQNQALLLETQQLNTRQSELNRNLEAQLRRELQQNVELERLNQALAGNLERSVELSLQTLQTFYPTLGNRARRVHQMCCGMADSLQLKGDERRTLEVAAKLHDIGLLGMPRELIRKWQRSPQQLVEAEKALIHHHSASGQELVKFIDDLADVGAVIRSHHESYDGTGYPDRLAREQIPWLARLLAAAVALVEQEGPNLDSALLLRQLSGKRLDPEAVRVLIRSYVPHLAPRGQREVLLGELSPGMVLAGGVYTSSGMLLIPEGQTLSGVYIDKILNHHRVNPIKQSLLVYC
jgi:response regulator RpfG family c-di-GMP phosphodiesterase